MSNYAIMSIKKYHTFPQLNALQKHNNRELPLPNVDPALSVHNLVLFSRGIDYTETWKEIAKETETKYNQKIGLRKNSVIVIEIVQGLSKEQAENINIQKWAEKSLEWVKNKFGENNIIASTLHLDETSPHLHTEVIPIDNKGRLNAKSFTAGRQAMIKLHTSYGKEMEQFGLRRGEYKSKAKKKELSSFYQAVKKAKSAALPPQLSNEEDEEYIKRMENYCKTMKMAVTKLELELERANAIVGTRIAQEFSRYSHAVSLYEDLYEKYKADEQKVNERITTYRKIENRTPSDTLGRLLTNLLKKFEYNETMLTNWAEKGKKALKKIKEKEDQNETVETKAETYRPLESYISLEEAEEEFENSDEWIYDDDDDENSDYDI